MIDPKVAVIVEEIGKSDSLVPERRERQNRALRQIVGSNLQRLKLAAAAERPVEQPPSL